MSNLKIDFHLVVTRSGSVKVYKNVPNLGANEISVAMRLELPHKLFDRPQFKAELVIPDTAVQSTAVPVDFTDTLQEAIQQQTGYEVKLSFVPMEQKGGSDESH